MKRKNSNILKKTIKIAGVTCFALGGGALVASGAAVKALTEGAKYLKNTVEKIVHETPETEQIVEEVPDAAVAEEVLSAEAEA